MKRKTNPRARRIVILQGSPNPEGNTATLADHIARGAAAAGAAVQTFFLQNLTLASCTACQKCQERGSGKCVIDDDMAGIYPAVRAADAVVFASPIYWFTVSAQLKQALDRLYALNTPDGHCLAGKRIGLAFTFGGDDVFDSGCINAIRTFQDIFAFVKAPIVGMVYGSTAAGPIRADRALMSKARDLGRNLAQG